MVKQRPGATGYSRRQFVGAVGVAGIATVGGCLGDTAGGESPTIAVLAAGSLQNALANGLRPAVDVPVRVETHGSATVARMIGEGQRDPDIVTVADTALFDSPLSPPWHAVFTSNSIVIVYDPDSEGGRRIAAAGPENWYGPLVDGNVDLGRTDPDQDPLGYRTLFMFELASRYYDGVSNLGGKILRDDQLYPESGLLSQFETGGIDAAVAYRNMAVERDYAYIELPDRVDLSTPRHAADWYSTVSYTLPGGQEIRGGPIGYGSTIRRMSDAAVSVFEAHTTGRYLAEHGFLLRESFPTYSGDVPRRVRRATDDPTTAQSTDGPTPARTELSSDVSEITVLH